MPEELIRASHVSKTYATGPTAVAALRDVSLSIAKGEMVAIMGPSGCGKTTLLHCLSGLDEVDDGEVVVAGRALRSLTDDERTHFRARQMGFVFQSFNLLPVLTAEENVELPLLVCGIDPAEARRRAREALTRVGLAHRLSHRPNELSGGEQQRVAIARSVVNDPVVVWADEPTGNLDSRTGEEILALMAAANTERGQTYVIVTHDPRLASRCGRVIRLENGRIVEGGTPTPASPRPYAGRPDSAPPDAAPPAGTPPSTAPSPTPSSPTQPSRAQPTPRGTTEAAESESPPASGFGVG
ncbi:MAG: ABC transporter ATP-binding protein [Thermoplasmatota archaeon]